MTRRPAIRGVIVSPDRSGCGPDDLEVERQVGDGTEERQADDEADRARDDERPVAEELERQDGLARARLDEREGRQQQDADDGHRNDCGEPHG